MRDHELRKKLIGPNDGVYSFEKFADYSILGGFRSSICRLENKIDCLEDKISSMEKSFQQCDYCQNYFLKETLKETNERIYNNNFDCHGRLKLICEECAKKHHEIGKSACEKKVK